MVKKSLFCALLLVTFFMAGGQVWAAPITTLDVVTGSIKVGDTFQVDVAVNGNLIGQDLLAFGFDVIPSPLFSFQSFSFAPGFSDVSDPALLSTVRGLAFPGIPDDVVSLGTLWFKALSDGTGDVQISGLYDGLFSGLFYSIDGFDINSSTRTSIAPAGNTPVPIPPTAFLLGSGLVGLVGLRKRFTVFLKT